MNSLSHHLYSQQNFDIKWIKYIFRKILNETGFSNTRYMANANSQKHRVHIIVKPVLTLVTIDIMALTETWLGTDVDNIVLNDLIPDAYDFYHVSQQHQPGGRVALIYSKCLRLNTIISDTIFKQMNGGNQDAFLSTSESDTELSNRFNDFFSREDSNHQRESTKRKGN